jgi:hypothetical protein
MNNLEKLATGTVGLEMEGEGLLFPYILCYCWSFVTRREENANFRELFFLSYVYPMLPVSLDCSFLIAPSVDTTTLPHPFLNPLSHELVNGINPLSHELVNRISPSQVHAK